MSGPAQGHLLIAPATVTTDISPGLPGPIGILLHACDGDIVSHDGQAFLKQARLLPAQPWTASTWLSISTVLPGDPARLDGLPDCAEPLEPQAQRDATGRTRWTS